MYIDSAKADANLHQPLTNPAQPSIHHDFTSLHLPVHMFIRRESRNGILTYHSTLLDQVGVVHVFSTRIGGVSAAPFNSMNLGNPSGVEIRDAEENLAENYSRLHTIAGMKTRERLWVFQSHGSRVVEHGLTALGSGCAADAIVTAQPSTVAAVRYADCAPVLLACRSGRKVAAVHVGWRGAADNILQNAIRHFDSPNHIVAAIGPCIGPGAFEVGPDVIERLHESVTFPIPALSNPQGKYQLDLAKTIYLQLCQLGLSECDIDISNLCTFSLSGEFFSHRRDGALTGRMAALIGPKNEIL